MKEKKNYKTGFSKLQPTPGFDLNNSGYYLECSEDDKSSPFIGLRDNLDNQSQPNPLNNSNSLNRGKNSFSIPKLSKIDMNSSNIMNSWDTSKPSKISKEPLQMPII